jgi:hypothetical protein
VSLDETNSLTVSTNNPGVSVRLNDLVSLKVGTNVAVTVSHQDEKIDSDLICEKVYVQTTKAMEVDPCEVYWRVDEMGPFEI